MQSAKKVKLPVLLVTQDDTLWGQIGSQLGNDLVLKQVDSIDEMISGTPAGQPAIILWDARNQTDPPAVFATLQSHSPRFAVVALDEADNESAWANSVALRQVVAYLGVPIAPEKLGAAVKSAQEEVNARVGMLGDGSNDAPAPVAAPADIIGTADSTVVPESSSPRQLPWMPIAIGLGVVIACAGAFAVFHHSDNSGKPAPVAGAAHTSQPGKAPVATDEKVDLLIEKAQQAMLERHFIDPAEGSALTLYRNALLLDPDSGEAHQGLQRLAEILFARVQSALDERKFDVALQALETARSINPNDSRLSALDERIASLRAEFGPAQILAAISAQNFDRATQLIDEAARTKSLNNAKLAQLREELRRKHEETDVTNLVKLIDTRLQQDKLLEPRNDSAIYYLTQARSAGASAASLQSQSQEINKRLSQMVHTAIEQKRFADADRLVAELHGYGVPAATVTGLQHDLTAARSQQAPTAPEQPQYLELAQSRLAQGKVTEPDNDNALFYVNQLRATDPKNSGLARISAAVQTQILDQARAALDANQPAKAEALLQTASSLGTTADLTTLNQRLAQMRQQAGGGAADIPEVAEAKLAKTKELELDYPPDALRKNIEGWVALSYVVTTEGKVTSVKVLDANPQGIFDAAAIKAISRLRYKPATHNGVPLTVSTKLKIAFRLSK